MKSLNPIAFFTELIVVLLFCLHAACFTREGKCNDMAKGKKKNKRWPVINYFGSLVHHYFCSCGGICLYAWRDPLSWWWHSATLVVGQAIYAAQVDTVFSGSTADRELRVSWPWSSCRDRARHFNLAVPPKGKKIPIRGEGRVRCEEVRHTCQKILIKLANDTNVSVARTFFDPVKIPLKTDTTVFFIIYMRAI